MVVEQKAFNTVHWFQSLLNHVVSSDTRQRYYKAINSFAQSQPLLFAFILIQALLSGPPVILFTSFVIGTAIFALTSAALFTLFWLGVGLIIVIPTLFISVTLGVVIWSWAAGSFIVARWLYHLVPVSVKGGSAVKITLPNGQNAVVEKNGNRHEGEAEWGVMDS